MSGALGSRLPICINRARKLSLFLLAEATALCRRAEKRGSECVFSPRSLTREFTRRGELQGRVSGTQRRSWSGEEPAPRAGLQRLLRGSGWVTRGY